MFAKMKTGTKVLSGFGIAVVITVIIGLVGYRGITKLNGHVENIGGNQLPSVRAMGELANGHLQVNYALRGLLNKRVTDKARAEQYELVEHGLQQLTEARKMYEGLQRDAKAASLWNEYLLLSENWKKEMQRCVEACREKDRLVQRVRRQTTPKSPQSMSRPFNRAWSCVRPCLLAMASSMKLRSTVWRVPTRRRNRPG